MVYNGHPEISLVVAGRLAPQKSLVLAGHLVTGRILMNGYESGLMMEVAVHHFQKSRHGL